MPSLRQLVAVPVILVTASLAHAETRGATERAARKACLSGDVTKGIELLSDLFLDTIEPTHIFNQGRCFEQNSRYGEAIGRFREYLRKASGISPEERADTEKHIADCRAQLGQLAPPPPGNQGADRPNSKVEAAPEPGVASMPVPEARPTDLTGSAVPASSPGRGLRIAGIACGAIALASLGAGVYFYTEARSYSDKVTNQTVRSPADEDAGKRAETMQWVFYSAGAAALATGTTLYFLGRHQADRGGVVGIAPVVGAAWAGVSARGAF